MAAKQAADLTRAVAVEKALLGPVHTKLDYRCR